MFQGLRQQGLIYILEKTDNGLILRTGQVVSVSNPQPKYNQMGTMPHFGAQAEMVVDVTAKVGEEVVEFKKLGANLSIANSGNVVVSDSREAMDAEVDGLIRTSQQHIDSTQYHEKIVESGMIIKRDLNPQFKKEVEQEEKMSMLEGEVTGIKETLGEMMNMLSSALGQSRNKKYKEE